MRTDRTGNSPKIENYWNMIQFALVRILIAMGIGFIIISMLNQAAANRFMGILFRNPSLSDELKVEQIWILLGFEADNFWDPFVYFYNVG